jgi:hypothetical protein
MIEIRMSGGTLMISTLKQLLKTKLAASSVAPKKITENSISYARRIGPERVILTARIPREAGMVSIDVLRIDTNIVSYQLHKPSEKTIIACQDVDNGNNDLAAGFVEKSTTLRIDGKIKSLLVRFQAANGIEFAVQRITIE